MTISAQVDEELAGRLGRLADEEGRPVADIVSRAVEEYARASQFPGIVFVDGADHRRRAHLLGGPDVWEVVFIAQPYDMDPERTARHFRLRLEQVNLALAYYEAYPYEIDGRLRRLDDLAQGIGVPPNRHPNGKLVSAHDASPS